MTDGGGHRRGGPLCLTGQADTCPLLRSAGRPAEAEPDSGLTLVLSLMGAGHPGCAEASAGGARGP